MIELYLKECHVFPITAPVIVRNSEEGIVLSRGFITWQSQILYVNSDIFLLICACNKCKMLLFLDKRINHIILQNKCKLLICLRLFSLYQLVLVFIIKKTGMITNPTLTRFHFIRFCLFTPHSPIIYWGFTSFINAQQKISIYFTTVLSKYLINEVKITATESYFRTQQLQSL